MMCMLIELIDVCGFGFGVCFVSYCLFWFISF